MTDKMSRGMKAVLHTKETVIPAEQARKLGELSVKVGVDVSEALTGLKALQREAKKATQELREMETQIGSGYLRKETVGDVSLLEIGDLSKVPTCELQRELEKREGVTTYKLGSYGSYASLRLVSADGGKTEFIEGPAIVTVNID